MADGTCAIENCAGKRIARSWCRKHYTRWARHGDPEHLDRPWRWVVPCAVSGCSFAVEARGWCMRHYENFRRHGHPTKSRSRTENSGKPRLCSIDECTARADVRGSARGFCQMHYKRWRKHGDATIVGRVATWAGHSCSVDDCHAGVYALGLCERHHGRWRRFGDPEGTSRVIRDCDVLNCDQSFYGDRWCKIHYDRERRARLRDSIREYAKRYAAENRVAIRLRAHHRRAREKGAEGSFSVAEWLGKLAEFGGLCAYCMDQADTKDHVMPLVRGGSNYIENIVPACRSCNSRKGSKTPEEWLATL